MAKALAKDLGRYQAIIDDMSLVDFKVRITAGRYRSGHAASLSTAKTGQGRRWSTVGVSANIVDASFEALLDAIRWKILRDRKPT